MRFKSFLNEADKIYAEKNTSFDDAFDVFKKGEDTIKRAEKALSDLLKSEAGPYIYGYAFTYEIEEMFNRVRSKIHLEYDMKMIEKLKINFSDISKDIGWGEKSKIVNSKTGKKFTTAFLIKYSK